MQITLKLKRIEPVKSDQCLAFTYLVQCQELGGLGFAIIKRK
jgi:hypothetical protein